LKGRLFFGWDGGAELLLFGLEFFGAENFFFGALGTAAFLAADFFAFLLGFGGGTGELALDFLEEQASGEEAVERLRAFALHFHFEAGGQVFEIHARGDFVYVLAAGAARANEFLDEIALVYSEFFHFLLEVGLFFWAYAEIEHGINTAVRSFLSPQSHKGRGPQPKEKQGSADYADSR